ncbi:MAG: hypothetical protein KDD53_07880 [Bdellovibrionales bacterium]|nr:hypothetical protein [Bdellovibrionales bacterium]
MKLGATIPFLRIFDEKLARDFYFSFLGFSLDFEHRFEETFPVFMQISKDDCIIQLSEHHEGCSPGAAINIAVLGLDQFCADLNLKQYKYSRPEIHKTAWGTRDMTITDPFANKLNFTEKCK